MTIWEILGLPAGSDRAAIRRGYARKLRETHPEDDPEGFKELRLAYEMALAYADHGGDAPEALPEPEPVAAVDTPPEIDALLAEREADIAALNALLGKLDAGLRGPWAGEDRVLVAAFDAVMRARAMGEISVRDDVEHWIANLIAATIPRSDAILAQAARAFGWVQDRQSGAIPAVARAIERLDEWAIIDNLGRDTHPLHPAWNSLTRPAGAYWSWRIDAFRPGMETGVETLLGERGPITPGLAHSFKSDSVARWRAFLTRPHVTLGMFAAIPLLLLVYFGMRAGLGEPIAAVSPFAMWAPLLAILAPLAPFVARLLRRTWLAASPPAIPSEGWVAAIGAVFLAAALLPPIDWALWPLAGVAAATWLWMSVAGGSADLAEIRARLRGGWIVALACLLAVPIGLVTMGSARIAALTITAALALTIAAGPLRRAAEILARRGMVSGWVAVALAGGYAVIALGASRLYVPLGFTKLFYPAALTLLFGLLVASAARVTVMRSHGDERILRFLKIVLVGLFAGLALFSTVEIKRVRHHAAASPFSDGRDSNIAGEEDDTGQSYYSSDGRSLNSRIATALSVDPGPDRAIEQLRMNLPGFAAIERGNPALDKEIVMEIHQRGDAPGADDAAAERLLALLSRAYTERLPRTTEALLSRDLQLRHARLEALRARSDMDCLTPRTEIDEPGLPDPLREQQVQLAFAILAGPADAEPRGARPYSPTELYAVVNPGTRMAPGAFDAPLSGRNGATAACNARLSIASGLLQATDTERVRATLLHDPLARHITPTTAPPPRLYRTPPRGEAKPPVLISF